MTDTLNDLLADMRRQVEYSDKITMPVPLYERIKTAITAMGDARKGASDEPPLEGEGSSAPTPSPATYTLNMKPTPDNPCGHTLRIHDICPRCGMLGAAEWMSRDQQREISVHPALAAAAEILANFKTEGNKLEEWQACYAKLFTQMNEICNQKREFSGWQPMKTAPKDGTAILLKFKDDLSSYNRCNDDWHETWQGIAFVGRNRGDEGQWAFAAPVGHGGFTDVWFEGWKPISEIEGGKS